MSARDEALRAAKRSGSLEEWNKAWKMTPEGVENWEWNLYQNMDPRTINPEVRDKVEKALGMRQADDTARTMISPPIRNDLVDAREIAERVGHLVQHLDREAPPIVTRLRAALRLLENEHITPQGRRIIEKILDEEEGR